MLIDDINKTIIERKNVTWKHGEILRAENGLKKSM